MIYAVRNRDGHWLRAKGYGGRGASWVPDLRDAKLYGKLGTAKGRAAFWARQYPEFGIPDIVEFSLTETQIIRIPPPKPKPTAAEIQVSAAQARVATAERDLERAKEALRVAS